MILLDLFSGIGGFHLGLKKAGFKFKRTYYSEIDKYANAVYNHNFKNKKTFIGDVRDTISAVKETPDIITFGSPCQDFSLAGKRYGLIGGRSSLLLEAINIVRHFQPSLFIWENVKGTFSSNGGFDFIEVLRTIADIGLYECQWQLVNTKWLLPQNRERIYLVGHLAKAGRSFGKVFPFREDDSIFIKKKRAEKGLPQAKVFSSTITKGTRADDTYIKTPKLKELTSQNSQGQRIYSDDGIAVSLNSGSGGLGAKTGLYKIHNLQPRSGDPKRGGTGHLSRDDETVYCIDTGNSNAIENENNIRRLTPIECERLQGYPDNYTQWGKFENGEVKEISDAQRYKMCGNSVTVDIVELIGKRLLLN